MVRPKPIRDHPKIGHFQSYDVVNGRRVARAAQATISDNALPLLPSLTRIISASPYNYKKEPIEGCPQMGYHRFLVVHRITIDYIRGYVRGCRSCINPPIRINSANTYASPKERATTTRERKPRLAGTYPRGSMTSTIRGRQPALLSNAVLVPRLATPLPHLATMSV